MNELTVPDIDADVTDSVAARRAEKHQIALFHPVRTDLSTHTGLLATGSRQLNADALVDLRREATAVRGGARHGAVSVTNTLPVLRTVDDGTRNETIRGGR